jgi:hypothetical protein
LIFLPADDQVEPITGFVSDATSYDPSPANPLGALVSRDIPGRVAHVRGKEAALKSGETPAADSQMAKAQNKWARLSGAAGSDDGVGPASSSSSNPLPNDIWVPYFVHSQWSQAEADGSNPSSTSTCPCENFYAPPNQPGNPANYLCGCVATAMAQVMRYFQYPFNCIGVTGKYYVHDSLHENPLTGYFRGGNGYSWGDSTMPLITSGATTLTQRQAIGALTWDAGLAVGMDYDTYANGGSAVNDGEIAEGIIASALRNTFLYNNAINSSAPESNLYSIINPNLDALYPVIFCITGNPKKGDHAIVCDGYGNNITNGSTTMYHHLNMGWYGQDDVWYNLPTIDTADNGTWTKIFDCVYNIYKSHSGEIISGRVVDAASNNPLSGVTVTATAGGTTYYARQNDVVSPTTSSGVFAIPWVPSNKTFTVNASMPGYTFSTITTTTSTDNATNTGNVWGVTFVGYQTGSLTVTISPVYAVNAGAKWRVDGGTWQASGATVSLAAGSHTVSFNTTTGWNPPANQTFTISNGQSKSLIGTYTQQTGSLKVTISPQGAITAGAQWNVDGLAWQASGSTVSNLILGSHLLAFRVISGWNTPAGQSVTITNGGTATPSGVYVQQTGSLKVTITPSGAVSAGAAWSVNGGTTWYASGATVSLAATSYTLTFKPVTGWNTPAGQSVTITNGGTATPSGVYVQQTGSLRVTITPSGAVSAGAAWSVNGGTTWYASGATVSLAATSYTLTFKPVTGWNTPASQSVTITNGGTATPSGVYLQAPTISSISGYNDTVGVVNGQWNGQGAACKYAHGNYFGYYAMESQSTSWLQINGAGFGAKSGTVTASDPNIKLSISDWSDNAITVNTKVPYTYMAVPGVKLYVTSSSNHTSNPFVMNVMGIIQTRGYGQCTWYVAYERLLNHLLFPPTAFYVAGPINYNYQPQQWDCLAYSTEHVAIITSAVHKNTVGNITTYTFTLGEMNPKCDEKIWAYAATFSVDTGKKTYINGIGTNANPTWTATGYYR